MKRLLRPTGLNCPGIVIGVVLCLSALIPQSVRAASNSNAKVLLHVLPTTTTQRCTRAEAQPACAAVITSAVLYPTLYFVHLLVADGDPVTGVGGASMGINYGSGIGDGVGVDIYSWTVCATLELQAPSPVWPASGGSNSIFWDATTRCQRNEPGGAGTGVVGNLGYFYCAAYSPATFRVAPYYRLNHPEDEINDKVLVYSCEPAQSIIYDGDSPPNPSPLGFVQFSPTGSDPGYNPCATVIPVQPTTWSAIKSAMN